MTTKIAIKNQVLTSFGGIYFFEFIRNFFSNNDTNKAINSIFYLTLWYKERRVYGKDQKGVVLQCVRQ